MGGPGFDRWVEICWLGVVRRPLDPVLGETIGPVGALRLPGHLLLGRQEKVARPPQRPGCPPRKRSFLPSKASIWRKRRYVPKAPAQRRRRRKPRTRSAEGRVRSRRCSATWPTSLAGHRTRSPARGRQGPALHRFDSRRLLRCLRAGNSKHLFHSGHRAQWVIGHSDIGFYEYRHGLS